MKKIVFILSIVLFTSFTYAQQKIMVTGKVIDSITQNPIEFATISFKNGKNIVGTTTDSLGNFSYAVDPGVYTLKIEFLSYKAKTFTQKEIKNDISLETISLSLKSELLDEIALVADKKLMEFTIDKKIYNASNDIANKGGTTLDVLGNTPTVRVDANGSVTIRGLSASILIDGKPLFDLENSTDILKAIPSHSIDRVEIIKRSAKYSAGKSGGILNIITKKRKINQTNGSVTAHIGTPDNNGISIFVNDKTKKANLYATISFDNSVKIKKTTLKQDILNNTQQILNSFEQESRFFKQTNSFLYSLGSDFYLNKNNTLTTSFLVKTHDKNFNSNYLLKDSNPFRNATKNSRSLGNSLFLELYLNYTAVLDTLGQQLSFDFKVDNATSTDETEILENVLEPSTEIIKQQSEKDQDLKHLLFKVDYELPLQKDKKLEFGYKGTNRVYKNDYNVNQFDNSTETFNSLFNFNNTIKYNEEIHAFYGIYNASRGKLSYSFGIRAEISTILLNSRTLTNAISNNYTDIFPSASLAYTFKNGHFISFDYHRGFKRPSIVQLNPFDSNEDEHMQYTGNQELKPSYFHYFEFLYGKEFKKLSLSSSVFLNFTKDNFIVTILQNGQNTSGQNIYIRKPLNNGNKNIIGFDVSLNYRPTKLLRIGSYISPYNHIIKNTLNKEYDINSWVLYTNNYALLSLNNGFRLQVSYIYHSKKVDKLTLWKVNGYANLTLNKSLMKQNATIRFKINDLLNSKTLLDESYEANAFTSRQYQFKPKFLLSFTYRFKQKRKSSKDRSNDINKDKLENKLDEKL